MMTLRIATGRAGIRVRQQPDATLPLMSDTIETILATLELPVGRPRRIEPHPELVASIRPTPQQMCMAAAALGWLPRSGGERD